MSEQKILEEFEPSDLERISQMREWVVGHYENASAYEPVEGKLRLVQTILDNDWINPDETWKLQALGIAFGDALEQEIEELRWVVVDDEFGRDPALRWAETKSLAYPLTSISKRVEEGVEVDVEYLFRGYQKAIRQAVENSA